MQFVAARDIREGMCVAEDVRDPQGRILIARGQKLGDHHLMRLRKFRIESIFIDPNNGEDVQPPVRAELREKCVQVLNTSFNKVTQEFAAKRIVLDGASIKAATESLIEALLNSKSPLVTLLDVSSSGDRLMQHSVNVTVLAVTLGIDLRVPQSMIYDLAVGMLFHDIGFIFLPEQLTQKTDQPPNAQEAAALRKHPQMGFEHLIRSDAVSNVAASIAARHHEALDGSGYPMGYGADKLSALMKIANVAETYDSLTSKRFGIPPVMPDAAISYLIANAGKLFAKEIVVALCQRVALYPKGSAVRLTTGEVGVVAGVLPSAPTRPVVLIHTDGQGKKLKEPVIVDLIQDSRRGVARSAPNLEALLKSSEAAGAPRPVDPNFANLG